MIGTKPIGDDGFDELKSRIGVGGGEGAFMMSNRSCSSSSSSISNKTSASAAAAAAAREAAALASANRRRLDDVVDAVLVDGIGIVPRGGRSPIAFSRASERPSDRWPSDELLSRAAPATMADDDDDTVCKVVSESFDIFTTVGLQAR